MQYNYDINLKVIKSEDKEKKDYDIKLKIAKKITQIDLSYENISKATWLTKIEVAKL